MLAARPPTNAGRLQNVGPPCVPSAKAAVSDTQTRVLGEDGEVAEEHFDSGAHALSALHRQPHR